MKPRPLIVFVPGLRPKPEPTLHKKELLRCLVEGIRRSDETTANDLAGRSDSFELVAWNHPFYRTYHDIELDRSGIEAVLTQQSITSADMEAADNWRRRMIRRVHRMVDKLPFLLPTLANEKTELHLNDLYRYVRNRNGVADAARQLLNAPLLNAMRHHRPTLVIGHSMGSVIAFDSLWQLTHKHTGTFGLDRLITLGSPLGQNLVKQRLLGSDQRGAGRYPDNIRRWDNITAVGDMTAIDAKIADDYAEMVSLGLVGSITDHVTYNFFRDGGKGGRLNVHTEYGYLINELTAGIIADWWQNNTG